MVNDSHHRIVALVPMRHDSVRVPQKNYRTIAGLPLYSYILNTLLRVSPIDRIVVDTDSPVICAGLNEHFPGVVSIPRPEELCGDDVPMNQILLHDVSEIGSEFYLQTHSTNPMLEPETIERAIEVFLQSLPSHDALFGVTRRQVRLWSQDGKPINHNPDVLEKTQDLNPYFEENSCIYIFSRQALLETENRLGRNPQMFEIPAMQALDIDTEQDFQLVKALIESDYRGQALDNDASG